MTQPLPRLASVYGQRLATHSEWAQWAPRMSSAPHLQAPVAPVGYLKPSNTFSADGADVCMPLGATALEVGATLGLVLSAFWPANGQDTPQAAIECIALCNDWQLAHDTLYRPPLRFNAFDGALGVGAHALSVADAPPWEQWHIDIHVNQTPVGRWSAADLIHPPVQMLQRMSEFTQWVTGDMLLLGCTWPRPLVRAGDSVLLVAQLGAHRLQLLQTVRASP
jgi:5-oxopent-3-ene-1,2,5-tricarboxylate decarboxylase / 2-hydroxyhepta-2,4-diene-1,7-dioate isomerase